MDEFNLFRIQKEFFFSLRTLWILIIVMEFAKQRDKQ